MLSYSSGDISEAVSAKRVGGLVVNWKVIEHVLGNNYSEGVKRSKELKAINKSRVNASSHKLALSVVACFKTTRWVS